MVPNKAIKALVGNTFVSCHITNLYHFVFDSQSTRPYSCQFLMGNCLPKEITTDILSRLPNESLWECKLVCKPWRDLIVSDPSFTHMHIQHRQRGTCNKHDSSAGQCVKRLYYAEFNKSNEKFVRVKDLDLTHREADNGIDYDTLPNDRWGPEPWEIPFGEEIEHYEEIVGSCNGLVCITLSYNIKEELFYKPLYVCNPMTRECVVLPKIIVPTESDDEPCYSDDEVELWHGDFNDGFGYSPSTNEYKVVRIYYDEVYVYTLGDGKGWRHIGTKEYKSGAGEYVHRAYNWLDKDRNLVSFDLEDEKFGVLPSPPCFRDWDDYSYELREDGECLSIVHRNQRYVYDIWLLKKKELEKNETNKDEQDYQQSSWSWMKGFTLYDDRDVSLKSNHKKPKPFAITKDSEVLFHDDRFFYRHDLNTRTSYPLVVLRSAPALGERDTKTLTQDKIIVQKCLVPELTYNILEDETKKRKERTEGHQCWRWPDVPG
ncbi:F-box protein At3g07870-like [Papaver somniferum]|uniref:F-box protein At3g07870-like n=1 Tax=Papaver somniferum TaxID=3469 RepID=UPI000E6F4779|nr:F-box protein At3g07870-like [Papaver somniferum]